MHTVWVNLGYCFKNMQSRLLLLQFRYWESRLIRHYYNNNTRKIHKNLSILIFEGGWDKWIGAKKRQTIICLSEPTWSIADKRQQLLEETEGNGTTHSKGNLLCTISTIVDVCKITLQFCWPTCRKIWNPGFNSISKFLKLKSHTVPGINFAHHSV